MFACDPIEGFKTGLWRNSRQTPSEWYSVKAMQVRICRVTVCDIPGHLACTLTYIPRLRASLTPGLQILDGLYSLVVPICGAHARISPYCSSLGPIVAT